MAEATPKLPTGISFVEGNVAATWRRFRQRMDFYFAGIPATRLSDQRKVGLLMTALGDPGIDVFNTFRSVDKSSTYAAVMEAFEEYCNPRRNTVYERFMFSQIVQGTRNVDAFVVELKNQAAKCEFVDDEDDLVRDRIVVGVRNPAVRKELLRDPELTLETAIEIARAWERSETEASAMTRTSVTPEKVSPAEPLAVDKLNYRSSNQPKIQCNNCSYEHPADRCPATDKECNFCKKKGHFAMVCKKRLSKSKQSTDKVAVVEATVSDASQKAEESAANLDVLHICHVRVGEHRSWSVSVEIGGQFLRFKIDTGAECNVLNYEEFVKLSPRPDLRASSTRLKAFGSVNLISPIGEVSLKCKVNGNVFIASFVVVKFDNSVGIENLIGLPTIEQCNFVKRIIEVKSVVDAGISSSLVREFGDVFRGLGKAPGQYSLVVKSDAVPIIEKKRRFPFSLRDRLVESLKLLEKQNIIARVEEPTDWVSNLVVVKKPNGDLRICLDPKNLNAALMVPKFEIPRADDILRQLNSCRYFTVLDLRNGFWQLELDEKSSYLTTFHSPIGRFRFLRLCFGVSSAPETFMAASVKYFGDLPGVCPYFDDLIVAGVTIEEHDANLRNLLVRARQYNFRFNPEKMQLRQNSVNFLGFSISEKGIQPLPKHVKAISQMPKPVDRGGVLRLLGLVKYLGRFLPSLSANTEAIRGLTKKNVPFVWNEIHDTEFQKIKDQIVAGTCLKFYNPSDELFIQTDSSKSGIGCCLYQQEAPLAYASRALTNTEIRYAQIEKELLAVVYALERFHDYTYGRKVFVVTDHRPLISLVNKHLADVTPRLQRLRLRLMRYSFQLVFKPGRELLVADTLSRAFLPDELVDESYQTVDVHCCERVVASPEYYKELVEETQKDPLLSLLKIYLRGGWPKSGKRYTVSLKKCKTIAEHLCFRDNLCFFKNRLFVPSSCIPLVLSNLHKGHLSLQKTKQLARHTVFWLNMNIDIENFVLSCSECLKYRRNNVKETLKSFPICRRPWERLHTDICTVNSVDYLVLYDAYSYWLEVIKLKTKQASEIVLILKSLFSRFGVPSQIVSDNMPFNSAEYLTFAKEWSFTPIFTSPRYPQANGLSEKAVSIAKSLIIKNPKDLCSALLQYRNAPIPHIGYSPAQLLMSRRLNDNFAVPETSLSPVVPDRNLVQHRKLKQQVSQEWYYNRQARDLPPLEPGDKVLYKHDLQDAEWRDGSVVSQSVNPRSYIVSDDDTGGRYLRNRRFIVKPLRFRD